MKMWILGSILAFALASNALPTSKEPPTFDSNYYAKGILLLPYAEINEPFEAYYDAGKQKSRVDYYEDFWQNCGELVEINPNDIQINGISKSACSMMNEAQMTRGTVSTYQRYDLEDWGISYKLAFMPDENGTPELTCFEVDGTEDNPVNIQSVIPDMTDFKFIEECACFSEYALVDDSRKDMVCELWESENVVNDKKNTYKMYLQTVTGKPIRYVMMGYNTLLGSHYDKYELYYLNFTEKAAKDEDFEVRQGLSCRDFPGPGVSNTILMNPMREYIQNEDNHIHQNFEEFKNTHNKVYSDDQEHERRKNIFRQNHRYVESMNRAGLSYSLKINHFADFTDMELHRIRGRLPSTGYNGGQDFPIEEFNEALPDSLDWRLYGAVTPVKDQAVCGSCWSFGTTGTIEGAYFLKTNHLARLSQQQLIDCSWRFQNNGCDGGEDFRAYAYIMAAGGLATEDDYGHYIGQDGICHDRNVTKTARITGFVNVTSEDLSALKQAIAKKGPISVSIDASQKSFSFYSHGVYYDPHCKSGPNELDHSVLAVGYGVMNNQNYWIVKNSWSTYWGNDGYVLMNQKDNNCGVATTPTYVLM